MAALATFVCGAPCSGIYNERMPFDLSKSDYDRFINKIEKTDTCWRWTGAPSAWGYGYFSIKGAGYRVSRVAHELWIGPIPEGFQVDHTCHDPEICSGGTSCPHRMCVNPSHLEVVTQAENLRRGGSPTAINARKTHCPQGHPYSSENTSVPKAGGRQCRQCHRDRERERWRALGLVPAGPAVENAAKTHCIHGHPFEGDNLAFATDGSRRCRTCSRENTRRRRKRLQ